MHDAGTDPLSPLARQIIKAAPYDKLVVHDDPGPEAKLLEGVSADRLLAVPLKNPAAAYAMLAGLYLRLDDLHRSHEIAQKSPEHLLAAAPFLHQNPSKTSLEVHSVENMEN